MAGTGTIYFVDLTRGEIRKEELPEAVYRKYPATGAPTPGKLAELDLDWLPTA